MMTPVTLRLMHCLTLLLFLFMFTLAFSSVRGTENNIFAAIAHMEPLVFIERNLVGMARTYLNEQRKMLRELAPFKKSLEEAMTLLESDPEMYMKNPINYFLTTRRFSTDWKELPSRLAVDNESISKKIQVWLDFYNIYMPSEDGDVFGAASAIIRLMDSYDYTARDISDGKVPILNTSMLKFTADDCMDIADSAHWLQRYVRMKQWLLEAERLMNDPKMVHRHGNTTRQYVNEYLAWSYYLENDLETALKYTLLVLEDDPDNELFIENREIYTWYIENNTPCTHKETEFMAMAEGILRKQQENAYVQSCKKKDSKAVGYTDVWNLTCYYLKDSPRLILKPVKVTQMHDNPEVYLLHNILSENLMERLIDIATPRLQVARVVDLGTNRMVPANYRVSKSMFLLKNVPEDQNITRELNPIFESVTGLSVDSDAAEELQMNNYGLGGQYEFHHDYGEPGTLLQTEPLGNRLATLLLYLSNVESGGETVFTEIGLSVPPVKGSALFWYNLHRNGSGFVNTRHASCPVISGSKWVANKWMRERGNEFRRRCSLNQFE